MKKELRNYSKMFYKTNEQKVLLQLLTHGLNEDISSQIEGGHFSWDDFFSLQRKSGLHGYLFNTALNANSTLIPTDTFKIQKELYQGSLLKSMKMSFELHRVMTWLKDNGVDAITFKGPSLAKLYMGDINARDYCDLDILVYPSEVKKAIRVLSTIGYHYKESNFSSPDFDKHIKMRQECTLIHEEKGIPIDLHWGFHKTTVSYVKDVDQLFQRSIQIELTAGKSVKTLSAVDLLCIESIHLFDDYSKKQYSLKLLFDYYKIVTSLSEAEWQEALVIHKENGQLKKLLCWCTLVRLLFEISYPTHIEDVLSKANSKQIIARVMAEEFFEKKPSFSISFLFKCAGLFDSPLDSGRFLLHLLLFSLTDENKFQANRVVRFLLILLKPLRALTIRLVK